MLGLIQIFSSCHLEPERTKDLKQTNPCHKSTTKLLQDNANPMTVKSKCFTTEENAFIIGNAFQEFVMKKLAFAREG